MFCPGQVFCLAKGSKSSLSPANAIMPIPNWRKRELQSTPWAIARAVAMLGSNRAARVAIMVMATNNSIRVKAWRSGRDVELIGFLLSHRWDAGGGANRQTNRNKKSERIHGWIALQRASGDRCGSTSWVPAVLPQMIRAQGGR